MKSSQAKKDKIKQTLSETRERRKTQDCKVFKLKIDKSHLSIAQKKYLHKVFIEARWFYNYIISQDDVFDSHHLCKIKEVPVKVLDKFEVRKLEFLSSQIKQSIYGQICEAIKVLSKLKKRNFKIGKLKFKSDIKSIDFIQFNMTWKLKGNRIKLQRCKKYFKVEGLDQLPNDCEFSNIKLVKKSSGYYIHITTFQPKQERIKTGKEVGIDFGIKNNITISDNEIFNIKIEESNRLKQLQRGLSKKKVMNSNKRRTNIKKISIEYERMFNKKHDQVCKLVSYLNKKYDKIYIQDEQIKSWHKGFFGKQVQHSSLGAIKSRLKHLESIQVISKWEPTTKYCPSCQKLNDINLSQRTYNCECGYSQDRDVHAAKNILLIGKNQNNSNSIMGRNSTGSESCKDLLKREAISFKV